MTPTTWPCPLPGGGIAQEYALVFDRNRDVRLLIAPALFDEGNRMRRFTVEVMRLLDAAGVDCVLPDLPGTNESAQPLAIQSVDDWLDAMVSAANHFGATHVLGIRGGCLLTPPSLPGWHYAPVKGGSILRQMVRARVIASREAGREENREDLMASGRTCGFALSGYDLSGEFIQQFESLAPPISETVVEIDQAMIGGSGLWLRAEPDENREQADAVAAVIAVGIAA